MKKISILTIVLAMFLPALFCSTGWAAASDALQLVSKTEKEVAVVANGKKEVKRIATAKVLPGDTVIFTNHYANKLAKPADAAVITNPVPKNVAYVDGSAFGEGAAITFSIDNGKTFDTPGKLFKTEKGKKRNAGTAEYTDIRWTFPTAIPPGKEGDVGYKGRIK